MQVSLRVFVWNAKQVIFHRQPEEPTENPGMELGVSRNGVIIWLKNSCVQTLGIRNAPSITSRRCIVNLLDHSLRSPME